MLTTADIMNTRSKKTVN